MEEEKIIRNRFDIIINDLKTKKTISKNKEIADRVGYSPQKLNEVLKGRTKLNLGFLQIFCKEFNVSLDYLIFGEKKSFSAVYQSNYEETQESKPGDCNSCKILKSQLEDKERMIQELEIHLSKKDEMIRMENKQAEAFERMLADKDKQIEDLKNNLERLIVSKDEMLSMKDEAIKGKEAILAAKDEIIRIQSKRISELESHRETEDLKKILGTSERIGQENIPLTDIHPKDLSTKAKKGEYKV